MWQYFRIQGFILTSSIRFLDSSTVFWLEALRISVVLVVSTSSDRYEGGSICNENPFITPSTNALGSYTIRQTKDQSVAVKMVHESLFYLSKFNKLHTF